MIDSDKKELIDILKDLGFQERKRLYYIKAIERLRLYAVADLKDKTLNNR